MPTPLSVSGLNDVRRLQCTKLRAGDCFGSRLCYNGQMSPRSHDTIRAIRWSDNRLWLLDQRQLPGRVEELALDSVEGVAAAIADMVVRGAPAIGITAAYGVALAARRRYAESAQGWRDLIVPDLAALKAARPTAVNLAWAVARMEALFGTIEGDPVPRLLEEAHGIHEKDIEANYRMGMLGADVIDSDAVLTHCNTGSLATGGYGTALGVIRSAYEGGVVKRVYADETRPWLQGSRLTAWELVQDGIPVDVLCEGAAAGLMAQGRVGWVIVGADRIAANGDTANKVGTYMLAVAARYHGLGFMVVAPTSTLDLATPTGAEIAVEERSPREVLSVRETPVAPENAGAWNPVFDITPADLISAIVTERGVVHRPDRNKLATLMANP